MRGKGFPYIITSTGSRITPAYAGKRIPYFAACFTISDHPRLCGEKLSRCDDLRSGVGSPPPMRGKVFSIAIIRIKTRITPAYAGKRRPCGDLAAHCRDHPRLCGEKCCCMWCCKSGIGSPPPMRGKVRETLHIINNYRITPAYAGKRKRRLTTTAADGDHPRLCGEKSFKAERQLETWGSPPPMRGKGKEPCSV